MALSRKRLQAVALALVLVAAVVVLLFPEKAAQAAQIPLLALYSSIRMFAAYVLSLVFAIAYGTAAATNKRAGAVLLPILDVLQSVPILGFFPAALLFFINAFPGNPVGTEFAIIFLIFTSMAWNMAFGVYEALTTLPHDLEDASNVFGMKEWLRFRRLSFPATVPKLVYNSMLSWTVGWFYLVASEAIQAGTETLTRPGLGSFIFARGQAGDTASIAIGIGTLAAVVLILDTFLWRPLSAWSERFRMDTTAAGEVTHIPGPYERLRWLPRFPRMRRALIRRLEPAAHAWVRAASPLDRYYTGHPRIVRTVRRVDLAIFLVIFVIIVGAGLVGLVGLLFRPLPTGAEQIPGATLRSLLRLTAAYAVSVAWTIPVAALVVHSPRASRVITPALEVVASIPATALFPAIIAFSVVVAAAWGLASELAAFLIALFAMQWYLLFNVIAGMRNIPGDLHEAARAFGLRKWTYWKRLLLPAVVPSVLTGSITAWGAGWNALIVAEYISYGGTTYQVPGIGDIIAFATYDKVPHPELLYFAILSLIVVVLVMNKLLWRPLIKRASIRYRFEIE